MRFFELNNPNRKDIHTPEGIFLSSEEYANKITANGLRNLLKVSNKPITKRRAERCPLLILENISKAPKEIGYYI